MIKRFSVYCDHHDPVDEDPTGDLVVIDDLAPFIKALVTLETSTFPEQPMILQHNAAVAELKWLLGNEQEAV